MGKYIRILVVMLTIVGLSALLHLNEADAVTKGKVIGMKEISQQHHHVIQIKPAHVTHMRTHRSTSLQPTSTQYGKHTRKTSNHVVINYSQQHYTAQPKGATFSKQTNQYKKRTTTTAHHKRTTTTVKPQKTTKPAQPLQKKPHWLSQATKIKKVSPTLKVTKAKTSRASTVTTKMKTTKSNVKVSAKTVKQPTQLKAKPKSSYSKPKKNYYNQPPKAWSSNVPGGDNVRDFGQTTKESGIDDALKIMKKSGNKGVSIGHAKAKDANIVMVYNWNPTAKQLTYGTGTAIGRYTILTANHVVNDQRAHKPLTPAESENTRISILQQGSKAGHTLEVFGVQMLQHGDVSLVYTYEDLSQYMILRKIASEKTMKSLKSNIPIHMYHYGKPSGKYKYDPADTIYHSKGKYSRTDCNVNPISYYQMMAEPGSSGAAVLNSKNEIIGVHAFRVDSGDYKKYHLNAMAEIRGNLRKEILDNIF
ncbi:trypsin-like serine peptidase [Staphylococcus saccharolyticus]|uniref:trypsin-like serine peptidase n=1 Tax=Staphylococcus saccharolyticus TaxID=33028 RepID=UPI001EE416C1|nr:trypsin-like peptidase domain-containing protein [Staphylococcus saccharolyticus]